MYTLESLQQKNLKELKEISRQLNVLPLGDRRCRQNWINVLIGTQPPLLQLLEVPPGVEPVAEAKRKLEVQSQEPIEVQAQEPIEVDQVQEPPIESKFGRIIYPKPAVKPITQNAETRPQLDRTESADVHNWRSHPADSVRDSSSAKAEALGSKEGDRVLALSGNSEAVRGGVLPRQPIELAATFNDEQPPKLNEYSPTGFGCPKCGAAYGLYIGKDCLGISEIKCLHCDFSEGTLDCPRCGAAHGLYTTKDYLGREIIKCLHCWYSRRKHYPGSILLEAEEPPIYVPDTQDGIDLQDSEFQTTEPPIESKFGRIIYPKPAVKPITPATETSPGVENFKDDRPPNRGDDNGRDRLEVEPKLSQSAIVPAVKNSPGVSRKTSTAHQLLELFKSSAVILGDSPAAETEAETLESAIGLAAKNLLDAEADQNPILTNITFSPGFLARYSPPQPENIHYQSDADGQLSLLDFEVESVDEPPDPDDFETLNAFREAIALWDAEHPEPLEVSLNSMSEWAPCPDDWYEPDILLELSEVLELSPAIESSITCKFLIPVFDAWCDRANRQNDTDEPPDTGIFARLPGPKPPKFPPMAIALIDTAKKCFNANRHTTRITIAAQAHITRIAAGSSSKSPRSPPGGDAM
ncbi:MAG: hypothetical protein U7126_17245 [Microcoleus sp.]